MQKEEEIFSFIKDDVLRENIQHVFGHFVLLQQLVEKVPASAKPEFYKSIIVYTGVIMEAILHYELKRVLAGIKERPLETDWSAIETHPIHEFDKKNRIIWCRQVRKEFSLKRNTDFKKLNEVCLKLGILDGRHFKECEEVRALRNKIHLAGLAEVDRGYEKRTVTHVLEIAQRVINLVEK